MAVQFSCGSRILFAISCFLFANQQLKAQPPVDFIPVITGLNAPVDFVAANDGTERLFVVELGGTIKVYNPDYSLIGNFLTVSGVSMGGERGLLSLAFHPDYENPDPSIGGFLYVYYTNLSGDIEIARYHADPVTSNSIDPSTKEIVITIPHPVFDSHNGGKLNFGPDGNLYFATGDGGNAGDPPNNAQNSGTLLGKMNRITVTNSSTAPFYTIPIDNPWAGVQAPDTANAIWAFGLRNPFRWSFDRLTGDIWIGDVGQDGREEINFTPASSTGTENYGWRCYEGSLPYNTSSCVLPGNFQFPVFEYDHPAIGPAAVSAGYVYRGSLYPILQGYYIACDAYSEVVYLINASTKATTINPIPSPDGTISFGESETAEIYAVSINTGAIYHLVVPGNLPAELITFTAVPKSGVVELRWKTSTEQNVSHFDIEYSSNGASYSKIGMVTAENKPDGANYSYDHIPFLSGKVQYRLKIVDLDGQQEYSPIRSIDLSVKSALFIYPSVIKNGKLNMYISQPWQTAEVINMHGAVVSKENIQGRSGKIEIKLPALAPGTYIVRLGNNEKSAIQKIIIR